MLHRLAYPFLMRHRATVRWNFAANVLDGSLYGFAMTLISLTGVVPVLITQMGGSGIVVGLVPVVWALGFNLPQVLMAPYVEKRKDRKAILLRTALVQRLVWLLVAAVVLLVSYVSPAVGLTLLFLGLLLSAVCSSLNMPVWFDMIARVTPQELRGRLFATRSILAAVFGIAAGAIVATVLDGISYPANFSMLFVLGFGVSMISYYFLYVLRDNGQNTRVLETREDMLQRLPGILRRDANFRNFVIGDGLIVMALVAEAFYAVHAIDRFNLTAGAAGHFIIAMTATTVVASLFFGYLADTLGHRINLITAAVMLLFSCVLALGAPRVEVYYLVFVGSALTIGLRHISRLAIIVELCREEDRPTYIALANMLGAPFALFAIFAGWWADRVGYEIVFFLATACALLAIAWLSLVFREPRRLAAGNTKESPS
jgi:MFS family permease